MIRLLALALFPLAISAAEMRAPVIVELFTSEGCSSCPSADKLLADIERTQPISNAQVLVLSEHVDYWNRLGWRDPFSTHGFSERQSAYADIFKKDGVYTPQMVVDGKLEFIGSNGSDASKAITAAAEQAKAHVTVTGGDKLTVNVDQLPGNADADVSACRHRRQLAFRCTQWRKLRQRVEPYGRGSQAYRARQDTRWQLSPRKSIRSSQSDWKRANLQAVVFVQDRKNKHILGAASITL